MRTVNGGESGIATASGQNAIHFPRLHNSVRELLLVVAKDDPIVFHRLTCEMRDTCLGVTAGNVPSHRGEMLLEGYVLIPRNFGFLNRPSTVAEHR
jgi:hypothetical protein